MSEIFNIDKIFDVFNYIFYFFILNLVFLFFNIPVILFMLFVGVSNITTYFPLFLLSLIPTMPAFTILIYCMDKLFKNKSLSLFTDIKKAIKFNFKQSFFVWAIELILFLALYSNIRFFTSIYKNGFLSAVFLGISLLLVVVTPFLFILISLFSTDSLNNLKNAFILTFTRPILAITNILILLIALVIFEISPGTTFLFAASIVAYGLVFANKALIAQLKGQAS